MAISSLHDVLACGPFYAIITGHFDHKIRIWDERSGVATSEVTVSGRVTGLDISSGSPAFDDRIVVGVAIALSARFLTGYDSATDWALYLWIVQ
ncbi:unnamed protein product [Echinostoma caproni]|uniref:WD_REPEATS_REGION domain-containing protein n=1 Tax=Echinostoma caproni TaxID=27848 RepID=A0A183BEU4_9TREM|nr:unnamed protein product [Echinostoma caproni]